MPISGSSILFKYSNIFASAGNSDGGNPTSPANVSTQGQGKFISTGIWSGGNPQDLFSNISGDENFSHQVDYRCIFIHNSDSTRTLYDAVAWLPVQTVGGAVLAIGADSTPASVIGSPDPQALLIPTIFNAPQNVSFFLAPDKISGVPLSNIPAGACKAIWIRRSAQNSPPLTNDAVTIRVEGDSEE